MTAASEDFPIPSLSFAKKEPVSSSATWTVLLEVRCQEPDTTSQKRGDHSVS